MANRVVSKRLKDYRKATGEFFVAYCNTCEGMPNFPYDNLVQGAMFTSAEDAYIHAAKTGHSITESRMVRYIVNCHVQG